MALFGAVVVVLGAVASLIHLDAWGVPMCVFKATTGYPCMTCGGTRALVRLAHLDLLGALAMNPLVALGLMALVLEVGPTLGRVLRVTVVPLLLANWAYLIAVGR